MTHQLKFSGKSAVPLSTSNRTWTVEECNIIGRCDFIDIITECEEDWAVLSRTGRMDDPTLVQVFAVAPSVYIMHQAYGAHIYVGEDLIDVLESAAEAIYIA